MNVGSLRQDHDMARQLAERQGIVFLDDRQAVETMRSVFIKIFFALQDEILKSPLALAYVYDQTKQPARMMDCDGFSSVSERLPDGQKVASVGVSTQALSRGEEYATLILLHELAHVTANSRFIQGEHGGAFHLWLDYLILKYNRFHSAHIVNDYFDAHGDEKSRLTRYDSGRPYNPLAANPPTRSSGRGPHFRTEERRYGGC